MRSIDYRIRGLYRRIWVQVELVLGVNGAIVFNFLFHYHWWNDSRLLQLRLWQIAVDGLRVVYDLLIWKHELIYVRISSGRVFAMYVQCIQMSNRAMKSITNVLASSFGWLSYFYYHYRRNLTTNVSIERMHGAFYQFGNVHKIVNQLNTSECLHTHAEWLICWISNMIR